MFDPVSGRSITDAFVGGRYGRKYIMTANLIMFIIFELASGFCKSLGPFLAARALYGICMGVRKVQKPLQQRMSLTIAGSTWTCRVHCARRPSIRRSRSPFRPFPTRICCRISARRDLLPCLGPNYGPRLAKPLLVCCMPATIDYRLASVFTRNKSLPGHQSRARGEARS